ncbi:MAG TPA: phenylacetate--CoA ligase, partial [Bauldia sp.]|nr:phenylacetate--CoA ligase [Bauldia sp.]
MGALYTPEPIETAGLEELRDLQLRRLKAALRRGYDRVRPTRAKFDGAGVHPDDLRSLDDLARFPFTTKDDLREA